MATCQFVSINGAWLPGVAGIDESRVSLADKHRTLSGRLRMDTGAIHPGKRVWTVRLALTGSERASVLSLVNSTAAARPVAFDDGTSTTAFVSVTRNNRVPRRTQTGWDFQAGQVDLLIEEA